tara:strand:+ start:855 stop:1121 length:267 start_codon:yes stop_codon:yes gene_type:complete
MDEKEKQLHNAVSRLKTDVQQLKEKCKILDLKFTRLQDEEAKLAIQEDGIVKALDMMVDTVVKVANKREVEVAKPEQPKTEKNGMGIA